MGECHSQDGCRACGQSCGSDQVSLPHRDVAFEEFDDIYIYMRGFVNPLVFKKPLGHLRVRFGRETG